ncbi:MAG: cell division protein FtsZ, partial [Desulfobacteraceae bacterium]|nr:cell division protein FtsZ [Desulfobacteraceae bacterium]
SNIHRFETNVTKKNSVSNKSISGKLRSPTEDELVNWNEFENPIKKAVGADITSNFNNFTYDNEDLDIPTFLRRKAD